MATEKNMDLGHGEESVPAVTFEDLEKTHGKDAGKVYSQIAEIGGFGALGANYVGGRPSLDINGLAIAAKGEDKDKAADAKHRLAEIKKLLK